MPTLSLRWQDWMARQARPSHPREGEPPFRAEVFNTEQFARHAEALALAHRTTIGTDPNQLLARLDENEATLRRFNHLAIAEPQDEPMTPAAEWLLDNFYLIEEQVQLARRHLPRGYSASLPRLLDGQSAGLPRVYDIVLELITHSDAQVDSASLTSFVAAYQRTQPLKLGELWAIPIMLRLGLIENLRRIASRLLDAHVDRDLAQNWADRLQEMAEKDPSLLVVVVADMAKSNVPHTSSFVAEFSQRLARQSPALHLARGWLEQRLTGLGLSIEHLVHEESQRQAADQVSVSHSIASLRFLSETDWREFVETLSSVDAILRGDPADVYSDMDFATRDCYRHVVESVSLYGGLEEPEVARRVVAMATEAAEVHGRTHRTAHVGYYLIEKGLPGLEEGAGVRLPWRESLERSIKDRPMAYYVGGIAVLTLSATIGFWHLAWPPETGGWLFALPVIAAFFCASQLAVGVMNWITALVVAPRLVPRLDFSKGIPTDCRTAVVVPALVADEEGADRLVEIIEIHYLANRDPMLHFALLTDFSDAPSENMPEDDATLMRLRKGIESLNAKYSGGNGGRFLLFHRNRRWNPSEGVWMGYERKRGKLAAFSAFIRGKQVEEYLSTVGETSVLQSVKYVITLDADTQLPRDVASELVGTIAHPLNRAVFDEDRGIVREGSGIVQPRVGISLPDAGRSWFARLHTGDAGIDPYTRAVSDVYQDLFGEGSFIGKGIYEVDAFDRALNCRLPENTILSHDLLESCHARSVLASDIELFESHPHRYIVDIQRRHRWVRGDWQIARWLRARVPGPDGRDVRNPLSFLSQWKILDNLRRSLVPVSMWFLLAGCWLLSGGTAGAAALLLVLATVLLPGMLPVVSGVVDKPADLPWSLHLRSQAGAFARQAGLGLLSVVFLPYEAFVSLDAIVRTWVRVLFTRRRLLQWQTSGDVERRSSSDLKGMFAAMWIAPAVALVLAVAIDRGSPLELARAVPMLLLWFVSPVVAWWISRDLAAPAHELAPSQLEFLGRISRKTWHFFETFVNEKENWLPPDNFQEIPSPVVATRTSPTNMGLAILANLAARDLGYITIGQLVDRTSGALETMIRLDRHRGHFYNWYDTRTLAPLPPLYVSTVDSGNLAGHLLTLASGLREMQDDCVLARNVFTGLRHSLAALRESAPKVALDRFEKTLQGNPDGLRESLTKLKDLLMQAEVLERTLSSRPGPAKKWAGIIRRDCELHIAELLEFAPWLGTSGPLKFGNDSTGRLFERMDANPALCELAGLDVPAGELWTPLRVGAQRARERIAQLENLARECEALAAMDFTFLFDQSRKLFSIGFNVVELRRDASHYDLLASEARLGSYVAIAQGQVPQEHWFSLGRLLVSARSGPLLVSWSGSMFEYLMPLLVMPSYEDTLLDDTCRAAVRQQIRYGKSTGVAWGVSESGYSRTDVHMTYQYRAFGVPGLGLKRGLAEDLVVAPYASAMALMIAPREACANMERLSAEGCEGEYGFYEAVDHTRSRLPHDEKQSMVRSFMVHHQGMSFLSFVHLMCGRPMQRRFVACPVLKAADLLLHERVPKAAANVFASDPDLSESVHMRVDSDVVIRMFTNPTPRFPEVHLLSNGRFHVVISSAGGGYSRWNNLALTRWREDSTRDCWGTFIYLRDAGSGGVWSVAHHPVGRKLDGYEAIFTQGRAEFRHRISDLETHTEVCVSPEDDVELRRVTLVNRAVQDRVIELTSYAEVVLAPPAADAAHAAFSNLFVQTEFMRESSAILCTRRARSRDESPPWLLHMMQASGGAEGTVSCETNRAKFVGRGGSMAEPAAMRDRGPLSDSEGSVLDPIIALRRTVRVPANQSVVIDVLTGAAPDRVQALALVEKYRNPRMSDRALKLAWTHSQVTLRQLNATDADAQLYDRLASALVYANPTHRAVPAILRANRRGQNGLWSHGISGDAPILLLNFGESRNLALVRQIVQAHSYWRLKGLEIEVVIINEDASGYRQALHDEVIGIISAGSEALMMDRPGGIFVRRLEQLPDEDRILLQASARVVLHDSEGTLADQLERRGPPDPVVPVLATTPAPADPTGPLPPRDLIFHNGTGGFTRDGREYVITLASGQTTPAPWVNVIANAHFGTLVSERGGGYTWLENAHEFRLTPWNNDPVQDPAGEAFYIRDEQSGRYWSPTPGPARGETPYVVRHGFGYTVFEHTENGIYSELWIYVAMDAPVKFCVLKMKNVSGRPRRISATGYWEWVLGEQRQRSALHVQTEVDLKTGVLIARNRYNSEFAERIVFVDVNETSRTVSGDRREFIGRNRSLAEPAAMRRSRLSGKVGAGLDPCGALQVAFDLPAGQERELRFRVGVGRSLRDLQELVQRFRGAHAARAALEGVWDYWNRTLGAVNVETPDPSVNVMANGWLLYQTLGCRIWGRTGFYQSGGAYGFRDQLQDAMALVHAEPSLTREHLLRAASRQFREGDVQHWWHPPAGRGVRTRFSDDFLWLPFATCRYVNCVADTGVLDEQVPFLEGRSVKHNEEAYYDLPARSEDTASLYDHCVRAIQNGLKFGEHGLPLMGCGDWNDGMNLVGREGRGESVWLAWFLHLVLTQFETLARSRHDTEFADRCAAEARRLRSNIEANAWDGAWYRRAYFDDGSPLGSSENTECQIDSLPQSWSVISGAGDPSRAREAMQSVDDRLVRRESRIVQLFDPPFDKAPKDPGYIKGYIPGVRENGGQYTHGAIWTTMAFALMGDHERAWELFGLLNPVNHGATPKQIAIYKVEPYVVAADIYGASPHTGRGGWTWYTGSAGWMYRLLIETLLGANLEGRTLRLEPRMPAGWPSYKVHYRFRHTVHHITISRLPAESAVASQLFLDGRELPGNRLPLQEDRREHSVEFKVR